MSLLLFRPRLLAIYEAVIAFFATVRASTYFADSRDITVLADYRSYQHFINKSYLVKADYRSLSFKVDEFYYE